MVGTLNLRPGQFRNLDAAKCRELIESHRIDEINVIDVRQPAEFAEGHVPGAQLIPLGELQAGIAELDRTKPTVVYCKMGGRGMSAAGILVSAGFTDVSNLNGGILAWQGVAVAGPPEAGWTWFAHTEGTRDLLERAWLMEEGAARFYERASDRAEGGVAEAFTRIAAAEREHKRAVEALHTRILGEAPDFAEDVAVNLIEGGLRLSEALRWLEMQSTGAMVEMAMALEATACDGYSQLSRLASDPEQARAFEALAEGERMHLAQVTEIFESLA